MGDLEIKQIKQIKTSDGSAYDINSVYWNGKTHEDLSTIDGESLFENDIRTVVNISYENLNRSISQSLLIPGKQYRITDYITTTTEANTQSANHPFDIIVTANSENSLNENARATQCFEEGRDGGYFSNSNLSSWEIKYCIDNDTTRFYWADAKLGKGVIYYMKDEFGNECPYDFKNIRFKNPNNTSDPTYYYTFSKMTGSIVEGDASLSIESNCFNNIIKRYIYRNIVCLNHIVFQMTNNCSYNTFEKDCYKNTFGDNCVGNTFSNNCYSNTFGNSCSSNTFGSNCSSNTFGNSCQNNTFGSTCFRNAFGVNCSSNTFGNSCSSNTFGSNCSSNTFGKGCQYNSFRKTNSSTGSLMNYCQFNHFADGCSYNVIWNISGGSSSSILKNININRGVCGTRESYNYIFTKLNSENVINVNNVNGYIYVINGDENIYSTSYDNLVLLRDNNQLIVGMSYRIIDYMTLTEYENTTSAEHPFDIIVTALCENALSEDAHAIQSANDTEGYFTNSKLSEWKIKYSLDNNSDKTNLTSPYGKGVIYRMVDEFGNDCPYDFKNIIWIDDEKGLSYYTFGINIDGSLNGTSHNNILGRDSYFNRFNDNCYNNVLGDNCKHNVFGSNCHHNILGDSCIGISFGELCGYNKFDDNVFSYHFGDSCTHNSFAVALSSPQHFEDNYSYNTNAIYEFRRCLISGGLDYGSGESIGLFDTISADSDGSDGSIELSNVDENEATE